MIRRLPLLIATVLLTFSLSSFHTDPPAATSQLPQRPTLKTIIIDAGHGLPDPGAQGSYSNEADIALAVALNLGKRLEQVLPNCKIIYTRTSENLPNGLSDKNAANRYRADMANASHGDLFIAIHVNSAAVRYERRVEGYKEETYYVYTGKGKSRKRVAKKRTVPIYKSYKLPCNVKGTETYIWAVNKNDQKTRSVGARDDEQFGEETDSSYNYFDSPEAKILASLRTKKYFDNSRMAAEFVEQEFKKLGRPSFGVKQRDHAGIWVLQATNMPSILVETGFICNPDEEAYLNSEKGQNELSYAVMRAVLRYKQMVETGSETPLADSLQTTYNIP